MIYLSELQKAELQAEFAPFFDAVSYGFECGTGWFDLIRTACQQLKVLPLAPDFRFLQIKEKFGQLTIYATEMVQQAQQVLDDVAKISLSVCESCGSRDNVTTKGSWIKTYCNACREAQDNGKQNA